MIFFSHFEFCIVFYSKVLGNKALYKKKKKNMIQNISH